MQKRMGTYANQSVPTRPQKRKAERLLEERGDTRNRAQQDRAEFLASINLSESTTWSYPLKTLPRPTGRATEVIITEYDLPRELIEPHDVIVGKDGNVWYTNFGEQNIGRMDPKTGKVTEVVLPELKKGWPQGSLSLHSDKDGNVWFGMMYQGAMGKFDVATQKVETFSLPAEMNKAMTQVNMVRPESTAVDGKVWSQNNGFAALHRLDLKTGAIETITPFKAAAGSEESHNIYDIIPDFAEQHLLHRLRPAAHRPGRRQDRPDHAVRAADQGLGSAPRHDGRQGPHLVRPLSRQQDRHVRHQGADVQGMGNADRLVVAL